MAAPRKKPNTAKATVWTETQRTQMEGPTNSMVYYMFMMVPKDDRQKLLDDLSVWNSEN